MPGYRAVTWYAMVAPPQTPAVLADRINRDVVEILGRADFVEKARGIQMEPVTKSRAEAAKFFAEETELWGKVIKAGGHSAAVAAAVASVPDQNSLYLRSR